MLIWPHFIRFEQEKTTLYDSFVFMWFQIHFHHTYYDNKSVVDLVGKETASPQFSTQVVKIFE